MFIKSVLFNDETSKNRLTLESEHVLGESYILQSLLELEEECSTVVENSLYSVYIGGVDNNLKIVQEGLSDLFKNAVEIFKNLIEKIKKFFKSVFNFFKSLFTSTDKFINENKDEILISIDKIDFFEEGFEYTFKDNVPNLDILNKLIDEYNSEISNIENLTDKEIIEMRQNFLEDENLGKLRGSVLGLEGTRIEKENFLNECKKIYRNGQEEKVKLHFDMSKCEEIVNHTYPNLKKEVEKVKKDRDEAIILIGKLRDFFQKNPYVHFQGQEEKILIRRLDETGSSLKDHSELDYNNKNSKKMSIYFSYKLVQSKEIGHMCITSITEKVNAMKEALKFYMMIMKKIVKHTSKKQIKFN